MGAMMRSVQNSMKMCNKNWTEQNWTQNSETKNSLSAVSFSKQEAQLLLW